MHHRDDRGRRSVTHQCWWEDLFPWVEQLYEEFGGQSELTICIPPSRFGVRPAVRLEVVKRGVGRERTLLWEGYQHFVDRDSGHCEKVALQLVSRALLELSGDKERSERQSQLPL